MAKQLSELERKGLEIIYTDMQNIFSFHKDYWTWEEDSRGYLIVRKKKGKDG
jgi:hypothetical protein